MDHRRLAWAIPFAMSALVTGCKDEASAPATTATATATAAATAAPATATATAAPEPVKEHWKKKRGGHLVWALLHAAHGLPDLKDAQKTTVDKLAADLHADHSGARAEMKDYHTALVAQVKAGKIEPAKLEPLRGAIEKAQQARTDKEAETLNALYAALDPAQRKAVVAAVRAKQAEHQAKSTDGWQKHRLEHLTKTLDLDAAQQKKVEPLVAKDAAPDATRDEMKKQSDAVLTAFEGDGFDAKKIQGPAPGKAMMAAHVAFLATLLPVLKPDQRDKLAASMEKEHAPGAGSHAGGGEHEGDEEPPPAKEE